MNETDLKHHFHVGDIVTGTGDVAYLWTTSDATMKVTGVGQRYITVRIIGHRTIESAPKETYLNVLPKCLVHVDGTKRGSCDDCKGLIGSVYGVNFVDSGSTLTTKSLKQCVDSMADYQPSYLYWDEAGVFFTWDIDAMKKIMIKERTMSYDIADKLRHLSLSDDDRLLLDKGIINEDGSLTTEGEEVVQNYAFQQFKAQIVTDLKTLEAKDAAPQQTTQS